MNMDNTRHRLDITWASAFGEIYCHHASLFIPFIPKSLFDAPDLVEIGVTVHGNIVKGGEIISTSCRNIQYFLPCVQTNEGLIVQINSAPLIDAICLNSWTTLKDGKRGTQKEFPTRIFYTIKDKETVELSFSVDTTPYLSAEDQLSELAEGQTLDTTIYFDL